MSDLEKINVLTKGKLDSLDLTQYPNQIFGTTDENDGQGGGSLPAELLEFIEAEREKSKNLLAYPYEDTTKTTNGITFTDNGDGSVTINGTNNGGGNSNFFFTNTSSFKLPAGTYTLSNFSSTNLNIVLYDGKIYNQVASNTSKTLTYNEDVICYIYIGINKGTTTTFNNVVVKPMLVSGTEAGEWHEWNGAIVHEKEAQRFDLVYDEKTKPVPLGNTVAYTTGIWGTVNMDLSKYKHIRAYYRHLDYVYTMIVWCDVGRNGSFLQLASDNNIVAALVSCTKTSFTLVKNGYYTVPSMTFNDRTGGSGNSNSADYAIYKIEGVY